MVNSLSVYNFINKYTDIFDEEVREASQFFFNKNIGVFEILKFEFLTKR